MLKRILDLGLAIPALIVFLPVILALMVAIRAESPGRPIFSQQRVGRYGRPFGCHKLRTMYIETPELPSHEVTARAITPLGQKLRRWKLDEVPQLWNIIKGEMSLVGPRPCLPSQHALIDARHAAGLDALRPGITGVAQVAGVDMSDPDKLVRLEATYLEDMSIGADLRLIVQTLFGAGRGDAANQKR